MTSRKAAAASAEALGVSPRGAAVGADLGGSSKYSNENFEGRSGEGFHGFRINISKLSLKDKKITVVKFY